MNNYLTKQHLQIKATRDSLWIKFFLFIETDT
jgi:hypothetical protein